MKKNTILLVGFLTVILSAGILIPATTHADTPPSTSTGCDSEARDCAVEDIATDKKPLTDITDSSGKALASCIKNGGNDATGTFSAWCGDKVTTTGRLDWFSDVSYVPGDIVKCNSYGAAGIGAYDCVVTHADGTYTGYHDPTSGTVQTRQHSADGAITSASSAGVVERTINSATNAVKDTLSDAIKAVALLILTLANFMLAMAGTLLNWIVVKTVFEFGDLIGNSPGLLIAWGILRDIGNMMLLFGFIFMGLATILDLHSFPTKKAIPQLLIFAVLMNFSLFAAEAVIDVANTFSSVMYSQANNDPCASIVTGSTADAATGQTQKDCAVNYGIAGHIMQSTGLSTIFNITNAGGLAPEAAALIGLALFATIGAIVLFAASIMLTIRVVVLTFIMVSAPIGFAGMAIPPLRKFANDWWSKLLHQAFFAPILFVLIFISLKVTDSFADPATRGSLANALTQPGASVMGIVLVFTIVIGFLVGSIVVAKNFGAAGASFAINTAKGAVLGSYGIAGGYLGRGTIGKGSEYAQKRYEAWMGKGHGGVRSIISNTKLDDAIAGTLKKGQNAKFGSSASYKDKKDHHIARHKEFDEAARKAKIKSDLTEALGLPETTDAERLTRNDRVAEVLERMSTKELEELDVMKKSGANLDALARNLSPEKFAALVKDGGALSEGNKNNVREARFKDIRDQQAIINSPTSSTGAKKIATDALAARVKKYSVKDLENAPSDLLANDLVARNLSNTQRDELLKGGKVAAGAARKIREYDPVEQVNSEFTKKGQVAAASRMKALKLNPKQVARLNSEVLNTDYVARLLSPKMLQAIQERNEINDATAKDIKNKINSVGLAETKKYIKSPAGVAYWS